MSSPPASTPPMSSTSGARTAPSAPPRLPPRRRAATTARPSSSPSCRTSRIPTSRCWRFATGLRIARANLASAEETLEGLQTDEQAGISNALDVAQQDTVVATVAATVPAVRAAGASSSSTRSQSSSAKRRNPSVSRRPASRMFRRRQSLRGCPRSCSPDVRMSQAPKRSSSPRTRTSARHGPRSSRPSSSPHPEVTRAARCRRCSCPAAGCSRYPPVSPSPSSMVARFSANIA